MKLDLLLNYTQILSTFIYMILIIKIKIFYCYDNFGIEYLAGSDLIDVTDYHNLSLIVTTAKKIYIGIPPILKTETNANLINASSVITFNDKYILAACLQDSLLSKVNLNNGDSTSLLNYDTFPTEPNLDVPKTSCSLSIIENRIFIGYTRIDYFENETNKTNIVMRFNIKNKESDNGPDIDDSVEKKIFVFPKSVIKTESTKQISCEPLRITNNITYYRLVCVFEDLYLESGNKWTYHIFATSINGNFDGFENSMYEIYVFRVNDNSGFKLIKLDDTNMKVVMKTYDYDIKLQLNNSKILTISKTKGTDYNSVLDLFDYSYGYMIYFIQDKNINYFKLFEYKSSSGYFNFTDYHVNNYNKLKLYYNNDNIMVIYQFQNQIRYFYILNIKNIYNLQSYSEEIKLTSNENKKIDINELIPNSPNLGVAEIQRNTSDTSTIEKFGFNTVFINNNSFIPELSVNIWYKYTLTFLLYEPSNFVIMYNPTKYKIFFFVKTCAYSCGSCYQDFYKCSNCKNDNYALINDTCYPINQLMKGYVYQSSNKMFVKCYSTCDFCTDISYDNSDHKCESCAEGYLSSYKYPGNCYKINELQIDEEKKVESKSDDSFASTSCLNYKIYSTGECVDQCPNSTSYYSFKYIEDTQKYEKTALNPPKYLFKKICYDTCPTNLKSDDTQNICKCKYAFFVENEETTCFSDNNCPSEYTYQNPDSKECFSSLNDCFSKGNNFFFNQYCYKDECPVGKNTLSSMSEEIQNNFANILSLNENIKNKICICNMTNEVWINNNSLNIDYYQKCLTKCPEGYETEAITKQCIEKVNTITTQPKASSTILNIQTTFPGTFTTEPKIIATIPKISTTEPQITTTPKIITTEPKITTTEPVNANIKSTIVAMQSTLIKKSLLITTRSSIITTLISQIKKTSEIYKESILYEVPDSNKKIEIIYPEEYFKNPDECLVIYDNKCYSHCPEGTCLKEDEKGALINCIPIGTNVKVFNDICFTGLEEIAKDLKEMAQNDEVITTKSGIVIHGYSSNSGNKEDISVEAKYSIIYLGECESLIKKYYNLSNDTELFILGIDSPSKNKNASTSVYNYGVYLENGTQLDHIVPCKESKISISSSIKNAEQVKLENASYFSDLGYDIYDESSTFYTDNCAPAAIDGNDVTLTDRKKNYYPNDISLCNDSCSYSSVNFNSKRFICECSFSSNSSKSTNSEETEEEESYFDYLLSLINYKIATCYELFFDFKSYYYNAGFYIAVGNLVFCIGCMLAFIKWGMLALNRIIYENIPTKQKLKEILRNNREKKRQRIKYKIGNNNNPPKMRKSYKRKLKNKNEIINEKEKNNDNEENTLSRKNSRLSNRVKIKDKVSDKDNQLIYDTKLKLDSNKTLSSLAYLRNTSRKKNAKKLLNHINLNMEDDKPKLTDNKTIKFESVNNFIKKKKQKKKSLKDIYSLINFINDEEIDNKELNDIPYTQALRIDNRKWFDMFLSVIAHEIEIINIFYYRNPYNHLTIIISTYTFELCLDLTLNSLLYTDDVVSEKFHNDGRIEFFTSFSLSFMSNIFSSIIAFIVNKLADYADMMELMISYESKEKQYIRNIVRFKKYLAIKLTIFYIMQMIVNLAMCYYLMIFCTVYHKTQGSIMLNYLLGIAQSIGYSLGLALITSSIRYLSIKYRWRNIYYTSKYFFDKF